MNYYQFRVLRKCDKESSLPQWGNAPKKFNTVSVCCWKQSNYDGVQYLHSKCAFTCKDRLHGTHDSSHFPERRWHISMTIWHDVRIANFLCFKSARNWRTISGIESCTSLRSCQVQWRFQGVRPITGVARTHCAPPRYRWHDSALRFALRYDRKDKKVGLEFGSVEVSGVSGQECTVYTLNASSVNSLDRIDEITASFNNSKRATP